MVVVSHPNDPSQAPARSLKTVRFQVQGAVYEASAADEELAGMVRGFFPRYECDGEAPGTASSCLSIARLGEGFLVERDVPPTSDRCETLADAVDQIEFRLAEMFLGAYGSHVQLHASGCVVEGRAVLAVGRSGAGKSSLATYWSVHGNPSLGDDVVLLGAQAEAEPFMRQFKVAPAILRRLGLDPTLTPFWQPDSDEAWFDPERCGGWASPTPVGLVALVDFTAGASLQVERVEPAHALNLLLHSCLPSAADGRQRFDRLVSLVERAPVVSVRFGDVEAAAEFLLKGP